MFYLISAAIHNPQRQRLGLIGIINATASPEKGRQEDVYPA
jgi:hypothetical protein